MKPKKMRAEIARRFPHNQVHSASTGVGSSSVQITSGNRRMAIMYQTPNFEMTPDEVEQAFKGWLKVNLAKIEGRAG